MGVKPEDMVRVRPGSDCQGLRDTHHVNNEVLVQLIVWEIWHISLLEATSYSNTTHGTSSPSQFGHPNWSRRQFSFRHITVAAPNSEVISPRIPLPGVGGSRGTVHDAVVRAGEDRVGTILVQ